MVEYKLPKLGVASSNLVARSNEGRRIHDIGWRPLKEIFAFLKLNKKKAKRIFNSLGTN